MSSEQSNSERKPGASVKEMNRFEAALWVVIPIVLVVVLAVVYWPR